MGEPGGPTDSLAPPAGASSTAAPASSALPGPAPATHGRPSRAKNPWDCAPEARVLPRLPDADELGLASPEGLVLSVSRLLHQRPDDTPLHLHFPEARRRVLMNTLAGYPEIELGTLPFDQPLHPRARLALALTLQLDTLPPLAASGGGSLRAELMWLDRLARGRRPVAGLRLGEEAWLCLTLAWFLAGVSLPPRHLHNENVLLNVCYDWDRVQEVVRPLRRLVEGLTAARDRIAGGHHVEASFGQTPSGGDASREDLAGLLAAGQWLLWARVGRPLVTGRGERSLPPPDPVEPSDAGMLEVRFRHIQRWLQAATRHPTLGPTLYRGASILLEAALSALRRHLLGLLGPGHLVSDGAGCLRFSYFEGETECDQLKESVERCIAEMFEPDRPSGRRFAPFLRRFRSLAPGEADPNAETHRREQNRRLAWMTLPPFSLSFRHRADEAVPRDLSGSIPIPVRRVWADVLERQRTCITCDEGALSKAPHGKSRQERLAAVCETCALKWELGHWYPRRRLLDALLSGAPTAASQCPVTLPSGWGPALQYLALDLNGVGNLLARDREKDRGSDRSIEALERIARRSLRFSAHWLLAIGRTMEHLADQRGEILVIAGDDLILASRHAPDKGDLLLYAHELHGQLHRLRDELPPCDGISFSGGFAVRESSGGALEKENAILTRLLKLEDRAKRRWKEGVDRLGARGTLPRTEWGLRFVLIGAGRDASLIATALGAGARAGAGASASGAEPPRVPARHAWLGSVAATLQDHLAGEDVAAWVRHRSLELEVVYPRAPDGQDHDPTTHLVVRTRRKEPSPVLPREGCCLRPGQPQGAPEPVERYARG